MEKSYNRYPDEKGTERQYTATRWTPRESYNRYPDEKGTESSSELKITGTVLSCYNRYPDEKGTERFAVAVVLADFTRVTTVTPMKRGLKAAT